MDTKKFAVQIWRGVTAHTFVRVVAHVEVKLSLQQQVIVPICIDDLIRVDLVAEDSSSPSALGEPRWSAIQLTDPRRQEAISSALAVRGVLDVPFSSWVEL